MNTVPCFVAKGTPCQFYVGMWICSWFQTCVCYGCQNGSICLPEAAPRSLSCSSCFLLWCNVYQPLELQLAGNQVEDEAGELVPVMIKTDTACLDSEPFNQQLDESLYKCNVHTVVWMRKIEYAVKRVQQKLLVSLSLPLYPANWQKSVSANG